jgi:hypothetical protein
MSSCVALLDSDDSGRSVNSAMPRHPAQTLRSLVVVPPSGRVLGQDGWTAGAGSSRRPTTGGAISVASPVPPPLPQCAPQAPPLGVSGRRRTTAAAIASRTTLPCRGRVATGDTAARCSSQLGRPPAGAASRIPAVLHGCCYNCGDEDHIAAECTKATKCVLYGSSDHISRECQQPRAPGAAPPACKTYVLFTLFSIEDIIRFKDEHRLDFSLSSAQFK